MLSHPLQMRILSILAKGYLKIGCACKKLLREIFIEAFLRILWGSFFPFCSLLLNQKQLTRGVLSKSRSENMQQICKRTPMPKCVFNKVAIEIEPRHGCYPVSLLHIFRTPSYNKAFGGLLLFNSFEWNV